MQSIGPVIGMAVIGVLLGWFFGRLCYKALRLAILIVVAVVALELVGFHVAALHWDAVRAGAQSAAEASRTYASVAWRILTYNLPLTLGFIFGLWRSLPLRRRQ